MSVVRKEGADETMSVPRLARQGGRDPTPTVIYGGAAHTQQTSFVYCYCYYFTPSRAHHTHTHTAHSIIGTMLA